MSPMTPAISVAATALLGFASWLPLATAIPSLAEDHAQAVELLRAAVATLASNMKLGDVVFSRVGAKPFREIVDATNSWANHLGVVLDPSGPEPIIGESKALRTAFDGVAVATANL